MFVACAPHLDAMAADTSVRCVVLTGAGRSFCAGHDLGSIAEGERHESPHFEPETVDALEQLPQPTIAKLHGHCFTGGLELALACDLLIAASSTTLGDTHGQWGLAPVWGMSVRLPERVGVARQGADVHQPADHAAEARSSVSSTAPSPTTSLDAAVDALVRGDPRQLVGYEPHRQAAAADRRETSRLRRVAPRALAAVRAARRHVGADGPPATVSRSAACLQRSAHSPPNRRRA